VLSSLPNEDRTHGVLRHLLNARTQQTHRKKRKDALSVTPGVSIIRPKRLSEGLRGLRGIQGFQGLRGLRGLQGLQGLRVSGKTMRVAFECPGVSIYYTTTQNIIATPWGRAIPRGRATTRG